MRKLLAAIATLILLAVSPHITAIITTASNYSALDVVARNRMLLDISFQIVDIVDYNDTRYIVVNSTNALPYASGIDIFASSGARVSKKEEALAILTQVVFRKELSQITISDIEALRDFHRQVLTLREAVVPYKSYTESIIYWLTNKSCITMFNKKVCAIDAIKEIGISEVSQLKDEVYSLNSYLGMIVDSSSRIDSCLPVVIDELERYIYGENIPFSALKAPLSECSSAFKDLKRGVDGINSKVSNLVNMLTTVQKYLESIGRRDPTGLVRRFIDYFADLLSDLESLAEKASLSLSTISEKASEYSTKFSALASPEEKAKKELFEPWCSRVVAPIMIYSTLGLITGILLTAVLAIITTYNREGFVGCSRVRTLLTPIAYIVVAVIIFSAFLYLMTGRITVNPIDHFVELGRLGIDNTMIVIAASIASTILLGSVIIYGINRNRSNFRRSLRLSAELALAPLIDIYIVYILFFLVIVSMAVVLFLSIGAGREPSIMLFAVLPLLIGIGILRGGKVRYESDIIQGVPGITLLAYGILIIITPLILNALSYILPINISYSFEFALISLFIGFASMGGCFAFVYLGSMRTIGLLMIIITLLSGLYNSIIGIIVILISVTLIALGGMEDKAVDRGEADFVRIAMFFALITISLLVFFVLPQINLDQEVLLNSSINSVLGPFAGLLLWFASRLMVGKITIISAYLYILLVLMISIFSAIVYLVTLNIMRIASLIKRYVAVRRTIISEVK
ncbi:hypothetical protein Igag_1256 [Ignisphaera aggregans DSM 17230]|uniref:Uncharacterized protein n=1 Tax=Ignisphaera aggregans (strain DSM 17230 / JCM 13409 / AQ1.S1) TaxID=583356 RepID=E0SPK6_IGNAA|nr:hypothetical protein Igag_1256 [Ignisphaera aggregans DSM 17230]